MQQETFPIEGRRLLPVPHMVPREPEATQRVGDAKRVSKYPEPLEGFCVERRSPLKLTRDVCLDAKALHRPWEPRGRMQVTEPFHGLLGERLRLDVGSSLIGRTREQEPGAGFALGMLRVLRERQEFLTERRGTLVISHAR